MDPSVRDRNALVAALRTRGVNYLSPSCAEPAGPMDDEALIASLASHSDPRLRQALIALFLLHPELGPLAEGILDRLEPPAARELQAYYTAAVYLQRMWRIRLRRHLGDCPELPDRFSRDLRLPDPGEENGKAGLQALAEWHSRGSAHRANHLSEYEGVAELLFQSLRMRRRVTREPAPKGGS